MVQDRVKRFWEIDFFRGIAIILMIVFHIFFDLTFFDIYEINFKSGFFLYLWVSIPLLFLLLVGISIPLKFNKLDKVLKKERGKIITSFVKRGLFIFMLGLFITLVTWFLIGERFIIFGILHLIGLSIIITIPLINSKWFNLFVGLVLIVVGFMTYSVRIDSSWFILIGIRPRGFYTLDYFPLLPWLGVVLIGIFIGNHLYTNYKRQFSIPELGENTVVKTIGFLGRHSLFIYLIHQPLIITVLMSLGLIEFGYFL
jgi:uncharacterized membrane protein